MGIRWKLFPFSYDILTYAAGTNLHILLLRTRCALWCACTVYYVFAAIHHLTASSPHRLLPTAFPLSHLIVCIFPVAEESIERAFINDSIERGIL